MSRSPEQRLKYQYLAVLNLLGDVAHRMPHDTFQDIENAIINAHVVVPGLHVVREGKRFRFQFSGSPPPDMHGEWQPLVPTDHKPKTEAEVAELIAHLCKQLPHMTPEDIRADWESVKTEEMWVNDLYTVHVRRGITWIKDWPDLTHLSIRRNDREAVPDWRHFQLIKNQLVGPECEGVELYPAESRLVDSANQYHVFVISEPSHKMPFGFDGGRYVDDTESVAGSRQRPRKNPTVSGSGADCGIDAVGTNA